MKTRLLTAALAATLVFAGCQNAAGGGNTAGGSVAVSKDDALVYAADSDLDAVFVYDTKRDEVVSAIAVGRQPEKVLVAPDGTLFVTNRYGRSVSVIHEGDTSETARLKVAVEPVGLALTEDGKTLYVLNAASLEDPDYGTVMAFDTNTLTMKWETAVGQEPRGITMVGDGRLAVTLSKQGDLVFLDSKTGKVSHSGTGLFEALNAALLGVADTIDGGVGTHTTRARALEALTVTPSGTQLFATAQLSSDVIVRDPEPPDGGGGTPVGGYGGSIIVSSVSGQSDSPRATSVSAPALLTFSGEGEPLVGKGNPRTVLSPPDAGQFVQGPRAVALDRNGAFAFIVNESTNNVTVLATHWESGGASLLNSGHTISFGRSQLVSVGAGPSGIALSHEGSKAWVYNTFDHTLSTLEASNGTVVNVGTRRLNTILTADKQERLSLDAQAGRRLFFSAVDPRMNSSQTTIACSSCHIEGREDGHVWNFSQGPRQTPSLAGRHTTQTAPFHWAGEFDNLTQFMTHTVERRMGGSGVDLEMERQLGAFIDSLPAPDNALKETTPADVLARGEAAFVKAECNTCHTSEHFTDDSFADVGTFVTTGQVVDDAAMRPHGGLNTPSILGVARTAPYLHDGSAQSLRSRILKGKQGDLHGKTSRLTMEEVEDLVAYLKTL